MDQETRDRIAKNEALFRDVNERVKEIDQAHGIPSGDNAWDFLCECGNADCIERISLTLAEYEHVRSDPTLFALMPVHEEPEVERAIERTDRFVIAKKKPGERAIAKQADPRS